MVIEILFEVDIKVKNQIRKKRELEVIIERHQYKLNLWEQKK